MLQRAFGLCAREAWLLRAQESLGRSRTNLYVSCGTSWFSAGYQQGDIAASGCLPIDYYYRFLYCFSHENYSRY